MKMDKLDWAVKLAALMVVAWTAVSVGMHAHVL
jgi:hypothetical protein